MGLKCLVDGKVEKEKRKKSQNLTPVTFKFAIKWW